MKQDHSTLRKELRRIEQARWDHVALILAMRLPLRRGSLVTVNRRCGKPGCHCADGDGHPAKYLSQKAQGKTRMIYVSKAVEVRVAEETERYRLLRRARARLAALSQRSLEMIDQIEQALTATDEITGRKMRKKRPRAKARGKEKG